MNNDKQTLGFRIFRSLGYFGISMSTLMIFTNFQNLNIYDFIFFASWMGLSIFMVLAANKKLVKPKDNE